MMMICANIVCRRFVYTNKSNRCLIQRDCSSFYPFSLFILLVIACHCMSHTIFSLVDMLHAITAVPRSTQHPTLREMVSLDDSSLQVPGLTAQVGWVWGSTAACNCPTVIRWTIWWTFAMTINTVLSIGVVVAAAAVVVVSWCTNWTCSMSMVDSGALYYSGRWQFVPEFLRDSCWFDGSHHLQAWLSHQWSDITAGRLWIRWTMVSYKHCLSTYAVAFSYLVTKA